MGARSRSGRWSEAGGAVHELTQQVGVAVMAGVFLEHVNANPAQGYLAAAFGDKGVVPRIAGDRQPIQPRVGTAQICRLYGPLLVSGAVWGAGRPGRAGLALFGFPGISGTNRKRPGKPSREP